MLILFPELFPLGIKRKQIFHIGYIHSFFGVWEQLFNTIWNQLLFLLSYTPKNHIQIVISMSELLESIIPRRF